MCAVERTDRLAEIKSALKDGKDVRVISTQLIEAGVDIDFPAAFRAEAGLDSIAQSAGRCNREGTLGGLGEVVVFRTPLEGASKLRGDLRRAADATMSLLGAGEVSFLDPTVFVRYFQRFYGDVKSFGVEKFNECFRNGEQEGHLSYRSFSEWFQMIDPDGLQKTIIVKYKSKTTGEDSQELIEHFKHQLEQTGFVDRRLLRKLQRFTVTVPNHVWEQLLDKGLIVELEHLSIQHEPNLYVEGIGLDPTCDMTPYIV